MTNANAAAAEAHIKRIIGPTIVMGDGSYFDYEDPESTSMTIEDYAYGLAYTCRFRGQTRARHANNKRCFYSVAQHCELLARALLADGYPEHVAFAGLMHESGEVPWGDMPGPAKGLIPDFKVLEKRADRAISAHFGLGTLQQGTADLIKRYDIRMLATEKRDLIPQAAEHSWEWVAKYGYEPFDFPIVPYRTPDRAAEEFLRVFHQLAPAADGALT